MLWISFLKAVSLLVSQFYTTFQCTVLLVIILSFKLIAIFAKNYIEWNLQENNCFCSRDRLAQMVKPSLHNFGFNASVGTRVRFSARIFSDVINNSQIYLTLNLQKMRSITQPTECWKMKNTVVKSCTIWVKGINVAPKLVLWRWMSYTLLRNSTKPTLATSKKN